MKGSDDSLTSVFCRWSIYQAAESELSITSFSDRRSSVWRSTVTWCHTLQLVVGSAVHSCIQIVHSIGTPFGVLRRKAQADQEPANATSAPAHYRSRTADCRSTRASTPEWSVGITPGRTSFGPDLPDDCLRWENVPFAEID